MRVGSRVRILIINGGYLPSHSLSSGVVKREGPLRSVGTQKKVMAVQIRDGWSLVVVRLVIHSP